MAVRDLIIGAESRAWEYDYTPPAPYNATNLANWFIDAPWAHPVWSQYLLSLINLAPVEDMPPAHKFHHHATHEVLLYALDPKFKVTPEDTLIADRPLMHVLMPQNFVGQFAHESDEKAKAYVHMVVREVVQKHLSPDTDYRRSWFRFSPYHAYDY